MRFPCFLCCGVFFLFAVVPLPGDVDKVTAALTGAAAADKVLAGQFVGHGTNVPSGYEKLVVNEARGTGRLPKVIGADYGMNVERSPNLSSANRTLIRHWKAGGFVTVSCHSWNPTWDSPAATPTKHSNAFDQRPVSLQELADPLSEPGLRWKAELDRIAAGLKELERTGVVVLWRPFHEMNGSAFWWANVTSGPPDWKSLNPAGRREAFVALWRHMHDYFTRVKGLRNLIWVYSTEGSANRQFEKNPNANPHKSPLYYYPGDDVVDVVGVDWYGWRGGGDSIPGCAALAAIGKPVALTEFGSEDPAVDYSRLLNDIRKTNPGLAYFVAWDQGWSLAAHPGSDAVLRAAWVESLTPNR